MARKTSGSCWQERPRGAPGRPRRWVDVAGRRWLLVVEAPAAMMLSMLGDDAAVRPARATLLLVLARLVSQGG
jgi:hypothetical protein